MGRNIFKVGIGQHRLGTAVRKLFSGCGSSSQDPYTYQRHLSQKLWPPCRQQPRASSNSIIQLPLGNNKFFQFSCKTGPQAYASQTEKSNISSFCTSHTCSVAACFLKWLVRVNRKDINRGVGPHWSCRSDAGFPDAHIEEMIPRCNLMYAQDGLYKQKMPVSHGFSQRRNSGPNQDQRRNFRRAAHFKFHVAGLTVLRNIPST